MMAIGAICAAHERGIAIPRGLSIMGYDDSEFAAFTAPPLTTIQQPAFEMGEAAARVLIAHLESHVPMPPAIALPPKLVERKSVGEGGSP